MIKKIPDYVITVLKKLEQSGFDAYIVGGCVRDLLMGETPRDWDITTSARPKEIIKIFGEENSFYENDFGTVGIKIRDDKNNVFDVIETTTFRVESKYTDKRHPDEVRFAETLEEDLSRRDFTINAIALKILNLKLDKDSKLKTKNYEIIDPYNGQKDIKDKIIRAVGDSDERFNEDALRMMRAVRFAATLSKSDNLTFLKEKKEGERKSAKVKTENLDSKKSNVNLWRIEKRTFFAIKKNNNLLKHISQERIRDELIKIILSPLPAWGIELLTETELMQYIIPEIYETVGVRQNRHHYYGPYNTVYKHILASLQFCPSSKLEVRLAVLLHDIGKPRAKKGRGEFATFYGHEYIGAKMTQEILERLKFPRVIIDKTVLLVKNHMFYYNVDEVGEHGVRRVVSKVGLENINDLIDVRVGDRLGSGVPKAIPYKLRHFKYMVEKISRHPISVKQLAINGNDLIQELKMKPGPKIGAILEIILSEVINDPKINDKKILIKRARELQSENLSSLKKKAEEKIEEEKREEEKQIKDKYRVK